MSELLLKGHFLFCFDFLETFVYEFVLLVICSISTSLFYHFFCFPYLILLTSLYLFAHYFQQHTFNDLCNGKSSTHCFELMCLSFILLNHFYTNLYIFFHPQYSLSTLPFFLRLRLPHRAPTGIFYSRFLSMAKKDHPWSPMDTIFWIHYCARPRIPYRICPPHCVMLQSIHA